MRLRKVILGTFIWCIHIELYKWTLFMRGHTLSRLQDVSTSLLYPCQVLPLGETRTEENALQALPDDPSAPTFGHTYVRLSATLSE